MFKLLTTATVAVLTLSLLTIQLVVAQEDLQVEEFGIGETQEIIDPALKPELSVEEIQQWPDKKVKIIITIDSQIDSDRVSLDWTYPNTLFTIQGPLRDVVSVRNGQITTFTKEFVPRAGIANNGRDKKVEFGVRVNGFEEDVNYLSATNVTAQFNSDIELLPISAEYQRAKILSFVLNVAVVIFVLGVIITLITIGVKRFKAYLDSPDEEY